MRVAILDDYQGVALGSADWSGVLARAGVTAYADHVTDEALLAERLRDATIVVAMRERTPFPRTLFERLPNLRLLVTTGASNRAIDTDAARDHGVTVCGTRGVGFPTAELTWGLILALARHIPEEDRAIRGGRWQATLGDGLRGKTLGVIGLGRIGGDVAAIGRAFGMSVMAWSPNLSRGRAEELGVTPATSVEDLLERSDVVTLHLVLSPRTRGLIGAAELARMRRSAFLVNTSRGPIVDGAALVDALRRRAIAGAGLDVFDAEPLPAGHPLLGLDNVVLTPHIGYVVRESYDIYYRDAVEDILSFLDGAPMRVIVAGNPDWRST